MGDAPVDLAPIRGTDDTLNTLVFIRCRHPLALDMIPSNCPAATLTLHSGRGLPPQRPACGHSRTQSHLTDHITTATRTVLLYSCSRHPGTLDWTSLRKYRISRYRRNLQNRNSAAAGIAIRFGPKLLLKCDRRQTGPKYPTTSLDDGYKSSFSLNHYVQSLRPAHRIADLSGALATQEQA